MAAVSASRALGPIQLLALGVNGIIGVGIFFAPSQVAAEVPGYWGLCVYVLVFASLLPVAVIYSTLGGRYPINGGPYVWAEAAFGRGVAFLIGWLTVVSALFSAAAVVSGFAQHAAGHLGVESVAGVRGLGGLLVVVLSGIVAVGLRPSAHTWTLFSILKLVPLVALVLWFVSKESRGLPLAAVPAPESWTRATLVVAFAMQGFEVVPVLAREARASERVIPLATITCLAFVAGLYVLVHLSCSVALPALGSSQRPLVDAADALGGEGLRWLLVVGTNLSALGIAFGMFAVTPHYLAALGRQPGFGWLSGMSSRRVPRRALLVGSSVVLCLVLLGELAQLFVLSSVAVISQYAMSGLSLLRLAQQRRRGLGWRHVWPVPLALVALGLLLTGAEIAELVVTLLVVTFGGLLFLVSRWRVQ